MNIKTPDLDPGSGSGASGGGKKPPSNVSPPELEPPTPAELAEESETGPDDRAASETGSEASVSGENTEAAKRYKDRWLRAEAELQNFRRRSQREVEEARQSAEERGLVATIEQLDDLERALEAARESNAPESWVEGVKLVAQRMRDYLGRNGVKQIAAAGAAFDPQVHEAMLEVDAPADVAPGHVVQVVRQGYERRGRALRPARVIVARRTD